MYEKRPTSTTGAENIVGKNTPEYQSENNVCILDVRLTTHLLASERRIRSHEDGNAKCRKWGNLGRLWISDYLRSLPCHQSPFDRAHMTSYSPLIETMRLSFTVYGV